MKRKKISCRRLTRNYVVPLSFIQFDYTIIMKKHYLRTALLLCTGLLTVGSTLQAKDFKTREDNTLRMMSYNIRNGIGTDTIADLQRTAEAIIKQAPDILAVQEVDSVTGRSNQKYVLDELAKMTLMHPIYAPAINYDGGKYGIGILSKERPVSYKYYPLPGREEKRTLLVVEYENYVYCCTHLSLTPEDQVLSLPIINQVAASIKKPLFIAGDMNSHPDSDFIKGLKENFRIISRTKDFTYPADKPAETIDYIAVHKKDSSVVTPVFSQVIDEPLASDHRPIVATAIFRQPKEDIFRIQPYLQNPVNNGITVMWQTTVPTYSWVEYGTDKEHLQKARTIVDGQVICNGLQNKIRLENLVPGQKYYYRICSQEIMLYQAYKKVFGETAVSDFYSFTLPDENVTDFTALVFNDLHQQSVVLKALCNQVKNVNYDFVIFNGDCIDDPVSHDQATHFLNELNTAVGAHLRPVFYIRGNHEIRNAYSIGLRSLFDYIGDKTYGAFNWGDTRFVMLDCGEDKPDSHWVYYGLNDFTKLRKDQADFLAKELQSEAFKNAHKRILVHHIPVYGKGEEFDKYNPCRDEWESLLKGAPFEVDINGHTHHYSFHKKGSDDNTFPVVIGGGPSIDSATVMVLEKKGKKMSLKVINTEGKVIKKLKL